MNLRVFYLTRRGLSDGYISIDTGKARKRKGNKKGEALLLPHPFRIVNFLMFQINSQRHIACPAVWNLNKEEMSSSQNIIA